MILHWEITIDELEMNVSGARVRKILVLLCVFFELFVFFVFCLFLGCVFLCVLLCVFVFLFLFFCVCFGPDPRPADLYFQLRDLGLP